jgi:acetyl-CoA carboxylase biotin carboxylase subunit
VDELVLPGGPWVRVDTHLYRGYTIPAHYDSLMAKIMVIGQDRRDAISRMRRALDETVIGGVANTVPFLRRVVHDPAFVAGNVYTDYVAPREAHEGA